MSADAQFLGDGAVKFLSETIDHVQYQRRRRKLGAKAGRLAPVGLSFWNPLPAARQSPSRPPRMWMPRGLRYLAELPRANDRGREDPAVPFGFTSLLARIGA